MLKVVSDVWMLWGVEGGVWVLEDFRVFVGGVWVL